MKKMISVAAICVLAGCMGSGSGGGSNSSNSTSTMGVNPSTIPPPSAPTNATFRSMLNGVRASAGAGAVSYDDRLGRAAQGHANDMLANNYFSHTGLNGSSPGDRVTAQGYRWRTYGENIARGQQDEAAVLNAWQNSSGHRRNNENPAFEDFGLAKAGSGSNKYWVLVLATER